MIQEDLERTLGPFVVRGFQLNGGVNYTSGQLLSRPAAHADSKRATLAFGDVYGIRPGS